MIFFPYVAFRIKCNAIRVTPKMDRGYFSLHFFYPVQCSQVEKNIRESLILPINRSGVPPDVWGSPM